MHKFIHKKKSLTDIFYNMQSQILPCKQRMEADSEIKWWKVSEKDSAVQNLQL